MPPKASFRVPERVLRNRFHELFTPARHESRLNWSRKDKDKTYALGELIAEIGSCLRLPGVGRPGER